MRRTLLGPAGRAVCLELSLERPAKPGLRWEITSGRRLLLRQNHNDPDSEVLLAALVEQDRSGVEVARTDRYRSPIPSIRVAQARRRTAPSRTPEWSLSWAHLFADRLASNPLGPLHSGRWLLRSPESLPPHIFGGDHLVKDYPHAYLNWWHGWNGVLPLLPLPDADSTRVKAYRRQVREQVLPPVLLWDASCLDGYVLLDGHARLVAALAENATPPVLLLGRARDDDTTLAMVALITADSRTVLEGITRTEFTHPAGSASSADSPSPKGTDHPAYRKHIEKAQQRIADLCASEPMQFARTRAWPLPGGVPAWDRIAADLSGWSVTP